MPGMGRGLRTNDPIVVSAFHNALLDQGLIVLLLLAVAACGVERPAIPQPPSHGRRRGYQVTDDPVREFSRTAGPSGTADLLRADLAPRRDTPSTSVDAARPGSSGYSAHRGGVAHVGPTRGERRNQHLVLSPCPGGRGGGMDPSGDRPLAHLCLAGQVVPPGWVDQSRMGSVGLGLRRGVRGDLRAGADLAIRCARGSALLLRRRRPHRPSRSSLGDPPARKIRPSRDGGVLRRHGGPAGVAGSRLLERPYQVGRGRDAHRDGPTDGPDAATPCLFVMGGEL